MGNNLLDGEGDAKTTTTRSSVVEASDRTEDMKSVDNIEIKYLRGNKTGKNSIPADFGEPKFVFLLTCVEIFYYHLILIVH